MEIIPVIDLMDGQVVRAQRGERDSYRPIESTLCRSSDPLDIAHALLGLYPFDTLYIADLDAIQGKGDHFSTIETIRAHYPNIAIWLDAGFKCSADCQPWQQLGMTFVVGSESLDSIEELRRMRNAIADEELVLSLDWRNEVPLGSAALFESADHWPPRVIVMTLARVGSYSGPDLSQLKQMRRMDSNIAIYAAGGIRSTTDLRMLQDAGITGALLASALHDGQIDKESLVTRSPEIPSDH